MKIKIEAEPGELQSKSDEILSAVKSFLAKNGLHKSEAEVAPLPKKWGVLYAEPNQDGSAKKCGNCWMWLKESERCVIHGKEVEVKSDHVCGYHSEGTPMGSGSAGPERVVPISPVLSGLEYVEGGVSCQTCSHYAQGRCSAIDGRPKVEALACCARWEAGLHKSTDSIDLKDEQINQTSQQFEYKALKQSIDLASENRDRISEVMQTKIKNVLNQAVKNDGRKS